MLGILNQGICKPKIKFSLIKVLPLILIKNARNVGNILQRPKASSNYFSNKCRERKIAI